MKKINLLIIFVLAGTIGFITSCKKDPIDYASPTITFTHGDQEVDSNTAVTITGSVLAPGKLEKIQFFKDDTGYGDAITKDFNSDTTHAFTVVITAAEVKETFTFEVQVTDKEGNLSKKVATITVIPPEHAGPVDTKTALKIYCGLADQTANDYASLTPDWGVWDHSDADGNSTITPQIDVCYYNGNYKKEIGGVPHFVSPDAVPSILHSGDPLDNANTTYFKKLTGTDSTTIADAWSNIDDDTEIDAITGITESNVGDDVEPNLLETGEIIAFELADGKKGVFKLVDGTSGYGVDDYIIIDVIVQQNAPVK